jgi:glycosyltransferase involved in cell wall biosynthesis
MPCFNVIHGRILAVMPVRAGPPRVLVVISHYLPGFRSGGPVRSISAWIERLSKELDISVVCLDRDLGDDDPYPGVPTGTWVRNSGCRVMYLPARAFTLRRARRILRETAPDTVYLNSVYSVAFTAVFLVAAHVVRPQPKTVLAARGQLSPGALDLKRRKKLAFLRVSRSVGLFRGIDWQASSLVEAEDIRRMIGDHAQVTVARNLRLPSQISRPAVDKHPGELHAIFLSRISPIKNLLFALDLLGWVDGMVHLTIAGPIDDSAYWDRCQQKIRGLPSNVTVEYRGSVPNGHVAALLARAELLLLPTRSENFGHVIAEALEVGTPVLISDQTPWRGLEKLGAGWDLPLDDAMAFVSALQSCIGLDEVGFRELSTNAMKAASRLASDDDTLRANRSLFGLHRTAT